MTATTSLRPRRLVQRPIAVLAAAAMVAAATYVAPALLAPPSAATSAPRVTLPAPGDAAAEPATRSTVQLGTMERIAFFARRVDEQPSDFLSWTQLALAHADHARLTYDLAGYQRAAAAIDEALDISPENPATLRVRASIALALHDFEAAVADAERVLRRLPDDPAALAVLGDAQLELGRVGEAEATFDRLATLAGGSAIDVRLARLAWLGGDGERALDLARRALAAAPAEERGFYAYAVGEYARLAGDAAAARRGFELALGARPGDVGALVGLARIDAWEWRLDDALAGLRNAAAIAPQPEILALTADVQRIAGDAPAADRTERLVREIASLAGADAAVFDRQLLLFELDHGGASAALLEDAQRALASRPDAVGHDLVAWAAFRLGRLDLARRESDAALAGGIGDARLLYHAGAIALASGDPYRGAALLGEALAVGPALDPAERDAAEALLATLD